MANLDSMYDGVVNSPTTELSEDIDESQTDIPLEDVSELPSAPNLIIIGTGVDAETVRYNGIDSDNNELTSCDRGFQGSADVWISGTRVYRGYTEYDHSSFKNNINTLNDDKLDNSNNLSDVDDTSSARDNLGLSTVANTGSHDDLNDVASSDHHSRYEDSEAVSAIENEGALTLSGDLDLSSNQIINVSNLGVGVESPSVSLDVSGGGYISNNLTVGGDLTVEGDSTELSTETVTAEDNMIVLNDGESGDGVTAGEAGIEIDRGTLDNYQFVFEENDDNFQVGQVDDLQPVATRESSPESEGIPYWDGSNYRFKTNSGLVYNESNDDIEVSGTVDGVDISSHAEDNSAHHSRYTDSEAVDAVSDADDYVKNTGDTMTGDLDLGTNDLIFNNPETNGAGIQASTDYQNGDDYHHIVNIIDPNRDRITWERNANDLHAFKVYNQGASESLIEVFDDGDIDVPNGILSQQGNDVATEDWVDDNYNNYSLETHGDSHHDNDYYHSGDNPTFGDKIGFGNDSDVLAHNDSNDESLDGYYDGIDGLSVRGDGNEDKMVVKSGNFKAIDSIYAGERLGAGDFQIEFNSDTESLDFNYVG